MDVHQTQQLADIDQIVIEHAMDPSQFTDEQWWAKLRIAVDGTDYLPQGTKR